MQASEKKKVKKSSSKKSKKKKNKKPKSSEAEVDSLPHVWKGHDLRALEVPVEAWPAFARDHKGQHGYTSTAVTGAVPRSSSTGFFFSGTPS